MKHPVALAVAIIALTPTLSGCSFARKLGFRPHSTAEKRLVIRDTRASLPTMISLASPVVNPVRLVAPLTQIGRDQLQAANYGLAVETMKLALEAGEPAAPAYNGIAIAYAKIGRADLAASYFRLAIAQAPDEERYQWNLAHLLALSDSIQTASRSNPQIAFASRPGAGPAERSLPGKSPAAGIERLSAKEVMIRTTSAQGDAPHRVLVANRSPSRSERTSRQTTTRVTSPTMHSQAAP